MLEDTLAVGTRLLRPDTSLDGRVALSMALHAQAKSLEAAAGGGWQQQEASVVKDVVFKCVESAQLQVQAAVDLDGGQIQLPMATLTNAEGLLNSAAVAFTDAGRVLVSSVSHSNERHKKERGDELA